MTASVSTKTRKSVLITVPPILGIGFLMGKLSGSGQGNAWFDTLLKPPLMPSGWVFGVAWTALYILIGVALAIVWGAPSSRSRSIGLTCFFVQLALNFSWSPLFFGLHEVMIALVALCAILALSIAAAIHFRRIRPIAFWLMTPYLAWLAFATYLNLEILRRNFT